MMTSPQQSYESPEQQGELKRRRREKIIIGIIILLVITITLVEVRLVRHRGETITDSLLAFGLVNINTILLLLLTFLIFRNLAKLILERRQKIFGSKLRIRLVLTFVFLSLLPTLLMSFVAFEFISGRTEYQLNTQVEKSLTNSVALVQSYFRGMERKVLVCGQLLSRIIQEQGLLGRGEEALRDFLKQSRQEYTLENLEVFSVDGKSWVLGGESEVGEAKTDPEIFASLKKMASGEVYRQPESDGEMIRGIFPHTPAGRIPNAGGIFGGQPVDTRAGSQPGGRYPGGCNRTEASAISFKAGESEPLCSFGGRDPAGADVRSLAGHVYGSRNNHPDSAIGGRHVEGGRR